MTNWILILVIYTIHGVAMTHIEVESYDTCYKAGNIFKKNQPDGAIVTYTCVKGWEITNE